MIEPRVLKGFRDFLPEAAQRRQRLLHLLEQAFESFGFVPIDTPIMEYTEILLGKGGGETDKQIYRFTDHGGRDVSLRFDLTVPFARYMASNLSQLYLPFRRYHMAKVFRGENTQRGRYREFMQCDFDIVGTDSAGADLEILLLVNRVFSLMGVGDARIHVASRPLCNRFLSHIGLSEKSADILRIIDKSKKVNAEETFEGLKDLGGQANASIIAQFIGMEKDFSATLAKVEELSGGPSPDSERLNQILQALTEVGMEGKFVFDPSITRGLDYYTGIVFETFLERMPSIGSVCSGGRYDDLANLYTKERLPGVGGSVGLDRLIAALEELHPAQDEATLSAIVFNLDGSSLGSLHQIALQLRLAGITTEVYPQARKLPVQFTYAEKKNITLGVFPEKDHPGRFQLKNLKTRATKDNLGLEELSTLAKEWLS